MLTRFVRTQLVIFAVASVIGVLVITFIYLQAPTLLGIGKMNVKVQLPDAGGLYRFSNVTYRGVQVGKVTEVRLTRTGAEATLSVDDSRQIPADVQAEVHSVSAVGEQYLDLRPRSNAAPYLHDGSVIALRDSSVPQEVGPMLDRVSALIGSIPKDKLGVMLDELYKGFNGARYDLGSLIDSSSKLAGDINGVADQAGTLVEDSVPLLDSQVQSIESIRTGTRALAGVTGQLVTNDPQVRSLLANGPGAVDEASRLLGQIKPTLPVLLANLTTLGQVAVTYHPSLEQVLVLFPPFVSTVQSLAPDHNPTGIPRSDFTLTINDPPPCTVGFLPPSQWRSPADTSDIDTPDGLYCKLPQDSPIAVRGARNYPCMGKPGKRAPTVDICDSEQPYEPLAMRPHVIGPQPLDPNLIAQGIPPDDRVTFGDHIFGPLDGTPRPPGPPADAGAAPAAPSGFTAPDGPTVRTAEYDPATGKYVTSDGRTFRRTDLVAPGAVRGWKDLVLPEDG